MALRLSLALLCAAALPPEEELHVLQQLLPVPEPCQSELVEFEDGHVTHLMLEGRNLKELPEDVGELRHLRKLRLNDNQLQRLPHSFGNLISLRSLSLNDNQLQRLPDSFGNLKSLEHLVLKKAQLHDLPESFGNLTRLEWLWLNENQLQRLPDSFGKLKSLESLWLHDNHLQRLPDTLGDLKGLKNLYVNNNKLQRLPDSFGNLKRLGWLELQNNQLQCLPDNFGRLEVLQFLYLHNNQLQRLPDNFGGLKRLMALHMNNNKLQGLPESFGGLERLGRLDLSSNQLHQLPDSFGDLELVKLRLNDNHVERLPGSFGNLTHLLWLELNNNQLQRLPDSFGRLNGLERLDLKNNQLQSLPSDFGNLNRLEHLALQKNQLKDFLPVREHHLKSLKTVLLHENVLQCTTEHFCHMPLLTTLYLHKNQIKGQVHCLSALQKLQVLTLHKNKLSGTIPHSFADLSELKVFTVHANHLSGSIPKEISSLRSLAFFSAHDTAFAGSIPELNLTKDCADDQSMTVTVTLPDTTTVRVSCRNVRRITRLGEQESQFLHAHPQVVHSCPAALGRCAHASARGPTLLLHGNRLSCEVPQRVTEAPSAFRSLVLMGNALGNESKALPSWVGETEQQPFLYVSSPTAQNLCILFIGLALLCTMTWRGIIGSWTHLRITEAPEDLTGRSHIFVIKASWLFAPLAFGLLCIYDSGSSYYACGDRFLASTVAYFEGDGWEPRFTCLGWLLWILGGALQVRMVPKGQHHKKQQRSSKVGKPLWWTMWFGVVLCLSAPSMAYAVASTLPQQNSLFTGPWLLWAIKKQAALVMLLVDMLVTPKLAAIIARRSGIKRSMLLMAARSATMWLNATVFTLYLSEHCHRGWTRFWTVCDPSSGNYQTFNISLGEHQLLEPLEDLCQQNREWWATDACMRSVVGTLAPLFLSKMIQRAVLQPAITLVLWKFSVAEAGKLFFTPLAFLGLRRWRICTSRSLDRAQQATFLVTLMEVVLIWGAFIPLLIPAAALAAMANLRVFRVGTRVFGAAVPELEEGETGSMSKKYMMASVAALLIFQNWFAWTAQMDGRSLLLLASLAFLGFLIAPMKRRSDTAETAEAQEQSLELTTMS